MIDTLWEEIFNLREEVGNLKAENVKLKTYDPNCYSLGSGGDGNKVGQPHKNGGCGYYIVPRPYKARDCGPYDA